MSAHPTFKVDLLKNDASHEKIVFHFILQNRFLFHSIIKYVFSAFNWKMYKNSYFLKKKGIIYNTQKLDQYDHFLETSENFEQFFFKYPRTEDTLPSFGVLNLKN